jgi:hypothetical protein
VTNPDFHEEDRTGEINPNDPDPAAHKPDADTADSIGVPVGSAGQAGESDFVDGAEVGASSGDEDQSTGNPITPAGYFNETNTEG